MLTHNINAESGANPPLYQQVYDQALKAGIDKTLGFRVPPIPIIKDSGVMTKQQIDDFNARKPIMPKQLRSTKKGEKTKVQPSIRIAKAEMTLEGFKHLKSNLKKKERLNAGIEVRKTGEVDVVSKSVPSKSSRKSSRRVSTSPSKQSGLDDDPD